MESKEGNIGASEEQSTVFLATLGGLTSGKRRKTRRVVLKTNPPVSASNVQQHHSPEREDSSSNNMQQDSQRISPGHTRTKDSQDSFATQQRHSHESSSSSQQQTPSKHSFGGASSSPQKPHGTTRQQQQQQHGVATPGPPAPSYSAPATRDGATAQQVRSHPKRDAASRPKSSSDVGGSQEGVMALLSLAQAAVGGPTSSSSSSSPTSEPSSSSRRASSTIRRLQQQQQQQQHDHHSSSSSQRHHHNSPNTNHRDHSSSRGSPAQTHHSIAASHIRPPVVERTPTTSGRKKRRRRADNVMQQKKTSKRDRSVHKKSDDKHKQRSDLSHSSHSSRLRGLPSHDPQPMQGQAQSILNATAQQPGNNSGRLPHNMSSHARRQAQAALYTHGQKSQFEMANVSGSKERSGGGKRRQSGYPSMSRCARHVAIAYHIYYRQNSEQIDAKKPHGQHTSTQQMGQQQQQHQQQQQQQKQHLDPTLEARRLKERTEWLKRSQQYDFGQYFQNIQAAQFSQQMAQQMAVASGQFIPAVPHTQSATPDHNRQRVFGSGN